MGGLIMTKGTRRLVNHYNDEFSDWISFYRRPDVVSSFHRANNQDISIWKDLVNYITDPNSPGNHHTGDPEDPTLLPPKHPNHKNLRLRWKFFLQNLLMQPNQNKLADYIYAALTDARHFEYVQFDVGPGANQDVIYDDTQQDGGKPVAFITLQVVAAMPEHPATPGGHDPDDLD